MLKSFILPGVGLNSELTDVNLFIVNERINHPEYFRNDCVISGFYGNIAPSKWARNNTAAYSYPERQPREKMLEFKKIMEEQHLSIYLDISNPKLIEKDTFAYYDNVILETFESRRNYLCVSSNLMKDYAKKTFPRYQLVLDEGSVFVGEKVDTSDVSFQSVYASMEDMMKEAKKGSSIIVIDSICASCYLHAEHTANTSDKNREYLCGMETRTDNPDEHIKPWMCKNIDTFLFENRRKREDFIHFDELRRMSEKGYSTFKFDFYPFYTMSDYLDHVLYYLAVPERKEEIKAIIQHKIERNGLYRRYEQGRNH